MREVVLVVCLTLGGVALGLAALFPATYYVVQWANYWKPF